jgi:hypothetical protein
MMDLATMVERFGLEHISLGGPVFDVKKLDWLNGRYLRERSTLRSFSSASRRGPANRDVSSASRRSRSSGSSGFPISGRCARSCSRAGSTSRRSSLREGKLDDETLRKASCSRSRLFDGLPMGRWTGDRSARSRGSPILGRSCATSCGRFYVAISGSPQSLPLFDSMLLLGRDLVRERLRVALERLGGATKAQKQRRGRSCSTRRRRRERARDRAGCRQGHAHEERAPEGAARAVRPADAVVRAARAARRRAYRRDRRDERGSRTERRELARAPGTMTRRAVLQEPQLGTGHAVAIALARSPAA